jgi:hypothetical protein
MHTVRMTMNVDKALLDEVVEAHPGVTKTALVEEGLRALLAREASARLAQLGGSARRARRPKRSVWKKK